MTAKPRKPLIKWAAIAITAAALLFGVIGSGLWTVGARIGLWIAGGARGAGHRAAVTETDSRAESELLPSASLARSNQEIADDIIDALIWEGFSGRGCSVTVKGGECVLKGEVASNEMRIAVERTAASVPGVTSVDNQLVVNDLYWRSFQSKSERQP